MAELAEFNADPDAVICMHTADMPWEDTGVAGVSQKLLERVNDPEKGRETALIKLEPGTTLPTESLFQRVDTFVMEGDYSDGNGDYGPRTFIRIPAGSTQAPSTKDGCVIYMKRRNPFRDNEERMVIDTETVEWKAFPHRGADVVHFYRDEHGIDTSRYGKVYPEKNIPSHDHSMGEETLIVEGVFKDEHDTYVAGSWIRFPIGVPHAPFTEDKEAFLLIREGDLVW